jgi:hypothetical protein
MGTKFRTMLAPINASTGDGRRFQEGAISLADLPMPFEWVRSREGGHDGAVQVGALQEATVATVKQAVADGWISADRVKGMAADAQAIWGRGIMYDDVSREDMPRLAEDVAEAMHLATNGTLGPSVDLDSFEGMPVLEGTDDPIDWEMVESLFEENGEEPKLELLITAGRVRAATLVSIPAFAETSRPFEIVEDDTPAESAADTLALVASLAAPGLAPVSAFTERPLAGPTPITWDFETGRVFGHIATWKTCHVGYEGVCVTPPRDDEATNFAAFNRFPVETPDGVIWTGRLTVGGRHASLSLNASEAIAGYDGKTVAAHVRAYSDEHGIAVSGVIEPHLTATEKSVLARRKVSGDWRETPAGLSLVEVLALSPGPRSHSEPGFPVAETFSRSGRQVALVASLSPDPGVFRAALVDVAAVMRQVLADDRAAQAERAALAAELKPFIEAEQERAAAERAALAAALEGVA